MNTETQRELARIVEGLMATATRTNAAQPRRYFYPLSMATYGVDEVIEAIGSMVNFRTSMWEKTLQFERQFATYLDCNDAVMVNSGSSADLLLAFLLRNPAKPLLEVGDEILVPAVTWPTHVWSPLMAGFKVRLVDVDPGTFNLDLDDVERKIGPKTRALFLVHLMGNPCDMDRVLALCERHNLLLLEDCCESLGAAWKGRKVGNFGIGGSFSFFFSHHISTMEGGMLSCPNAEVAAQLRVLRAHGWVRNVGMPQQPAPCADIDPRYTFVNWGFNVRPTELQAGFGIHQMLKLPAFNQRRNELAERFFAFIDASGYLTRPKAHPSAQPAWFCLPLLLQPDAPFSRDAITGYLETNGVETRPVVTGNIARQPVARLFDGLAEDALPGADVIHERGFYIGLSPYVSDEMLDRLIDCFRKFFRTF